MFNRTREGADVALGFFSELCGFHLSLSDDFFSSVVQKCTIFVCVCVCVSSRQPMYNGGSLASFSTI